jgi:hypothetical protein
MLLGQAQLVYHCAITLGRFVPTQWYPATNGEHGRKNVAPVAAWDVPTTLPQPPISQPASLSNLPSNHQPLPLDVAIQRILDVLLVIRDAQLGVRTEVSTLTTAPLNLPETPMPLEFV